MKKNSFAQMCLAQISRDFLSQHKVYRYRTVKISDMDDQSVIKVCHWYCEENNLTDEFKQYREGVEITEYYIEAHKYCANNKEELLNDTTCGCFYCMAIFTPIEILEWIGDTKGTATCPFCGMPAVIGEESGFPITKEFLTGMNGYWFK